MYIYIYICYPFTTTLAPSTTQSLSRIIIIMTRSFAGVKGTTIFIKIDGHYTIPKVYLV